MPVDLIIALLVLAPAAACGSNTDQPRQMPKSDYSGTGDLLAQCMRYASESYCEREIWRRRELKWEYVDLDAGILNLPDSKSGAKTAYLGKPAIDTLRRLARLPRNPSICATRSQVARSMIAACSPG
jgi:hypothetical protein